MALLNKLFKGGSKSNLKQDANIGENSSSWKPPNFSKDQIRVLLFRECDGRSRKLLFDSSSVKKIEPQPIQKPCSSSSLAQRLKRCQTPSMPTLPVEAPKPDGSFEVSLDGVVYQYLRPRSDVKMLGEMIFGSVAMSFQGTATKIHVMRSPMQLMFSKVFPAPKPHHQQSARELSDSITSSSVDFVYVRQSDRLERLSSSVGSAEVPDWRGRSYQEIDYRLGIGSPLRTTNSLNSLLNLNTSNDASQRSSLPHSGSYNSLQRRWLRCRTTSMEFGLPKKWDDSSFSETSSLPRDISSQKRTKLGMSVIFNLGEDSLVDTQFQTFFFSHITLIENYINKLIAQIEKACLDRNSFIKLVMEGHETLKQSIFDLYTSPRLADPVWLSMMTNHNHHHIICLKFMTEFMSLVEQLDAKATKFFMSTLLTAVLSHHLAWVPTVTPAGIPPSHSYYKKHTAKWLHMLAKSHPYNPLWVQLGDLYGAVGFPCKMAKTIIIGKKADLVRQILYVLSYFIRCSEVYENLETRVTDNLPDSSEQVLLSSDDESHVTSSRDNCENPRPASRDESKVDPCENGDAKIDLERAVGENERSMNPSKAISNGSCELCSQLVLSGSPLTEGVNEQLRPGRRFCESCRKLYRQKKSNSDVRNGRIFDLEAGSSEHGIDGNQSSNTSSWGKDDLQIVDRDSGISGCGTEEQQSVDNGSGGSSSSSPTKVSFTIGDIPLKDICCPRALQLKQKSLKDRITLAKHFQTYGPVSKSKFYVCSCHIQNEKNRNFENIANDVDNVKLSSSLNQKNHILAKSIRIDENRPAADVQQVENETDGVDCHCSSGFCGSEFDTNDKCKTLSCGSDGSSVYISKEGLLESPRLNGIKNDLRVSEITDGKKSIFVDKYSSNSEGLITDFIGIPEDKLKQISCAKIIPYGERINGQNCDKSSRVFVLPEREAQFNAYQRWKSEQLHSKSNCSQIKEIDVLPKNCANQNSRSKASIRRKLCKSENMVSKTCPSRFCRSHSDDNLSKSDSNVRKTRSRHKSEAALSHQLLKPDDISGLFVNAENLPLPRSDVKQAANSTDEYFRGFAWSLVANFSSRYMSDFALQGTDETNFGARLCSDLAVSVGSPPVDEPVAEAICILADTDKWTVQVASNKTCNVETGILASVPVGMSHLVASTAESLFHLWKLKMSPEFCLLHLEDRLQDIYFKSQLLAEYLTEKSTCDIEEMTNTLGLDASDLPLLMAVASTHSPSVTCTYGVPYR